MGWSEDAALNRDLWTKTNAEYTNEQAAQKWALDEFLWGIWDVPEADVGVIGEVAGLDVVELGCGTAYMSAVFAKKGARPVGVDITPAQLETARRMMAETGIEFPLVEADAGKTGLPAESFDLVFSEYGASIWIDQERFTAESARLLRPGGRLVLMSTAPLGIVCTAEDETVEERLLRPYFGMHRVEWPDAVEFCLPHGDRIALLRSHGFEIEALVEVRAPKLAKPHPYYNLGTPEWARRWPLEEIWAARKRA